MPLSTILLLGIPVRNTVVFYPGIQLIVTAIDTTDDNACVATVSY